MVEQSKETPAERRSGEPVETKLLRIAAKARRERELKFVNLYYLMNEELLLKCFRRLSEDKAAGIDEVTKEEYAENLEANIKELVSRLHRMAYRPQPVRRVYIPKAGSNKQRPLGIPSLEDKLVQSALAKILGAIYEEEFIENSYGYRPERSCHDALRELSQTVENEGTNYIAEVDIKRVLRQCGTRLDDEDARAANRGQASTTDGEEVPKVRGDGGRGDKSKRGGSAARRQPLSDTSEYLPALRLGPMV